VTDTYDMDTFGKPTSTTGWTPNPYRYGAAWGYITDPSGFLQLGARYYWPEVGRFVQQDPIGESGNWYVYSDGNALGAIDPDGLAKKKPTPRPKAKPKPKPKPKGRKQSKPCPQQEMRQAKPEDVCEWVLNDWRGVSHPAQGWSDCSCEYQCVLDGKVVKTERKRGAADAGHCYDMCRSATPTPVAKNPVQCGINSPGYHGE
jgi:RHS repeat-associated protein